MDSPPNSTSNMCTSGPSAPSSASCARAPSTSTDRRRVSDEAEASPSLALPSLEVFVLRPALSGGESFEVDVAAVAAEDGLLGRDGEGTAGFLQRGLILRWTEG